MTKAEVLARLGETIPDDADVMAYHVSVRTKTGMNTMGHLFGDGQECLLHVGSIIHHVDDSLELTQEQVGKLAELYYMAHETLGNVKRKTECVRMEVPDRDDE